jgi:hypothetical protein
VLDKKRIIGKMEGQGGGGAQGGTDSIKKENTRFFFSFLCYLYFKRSFKSF